MFPEKLEHGALSRNLGFLYYLLFKEQLHITYLVNTIFRKALGRNALILGCWQLICETAKKYGRVSRSATELHSWRRMLLSHFPTLSYESPEKVESHFELTLIDPILDSRA